MTAPQAAAAAFLLGARQAARLLRHSADEQPAHRQRRMDWVDEQEQYENIFCVVDMHAITVPQDPATLRYETRRLAATFLAAGISLDHGVIIAQSDIDEHPGDGRISTASRRWAG